MINRVLSSYKANSLMFAGKRNFNTTQKTAKLDFMEYETDKLMIKKKREEEIVNAFSFYDYEAIMTSLLTNKLVSTGNDLIIIHTDKQGKKCVQIVVCISPDESYSEYNISKEEFLQIVNILNAKNCENYPKNASLYNKITNEVMQSTYLWN